MPALLALLAPLWGALQSIISGIAGPFFTKLEADSIRTDLVAAHERAAVTEASANTQKTIAERADERSKINIPFDPAGLSDELRREADLADRAAG